MTQDDILVQEQEEIARQKVIEIIANNPRCHKNADDEQRIRKAFELANEAHRGMRRKSGELYIFHPIAVAKIVAEEEGLGATSVISALLHDVVEDTNITLEDLESVFGPKVATIVDGLTKLEGVFDQTASMQAENFRKLLMSMIEDVRVILIKLADRLHNMRTLASMPEHKQYRIAAETLYIYAPMAHRLGLFAIKTELEDLSLKYEHPHEFQAIADKLKGKETDYNNIIESIAQPIRERLNAIGFEYDIKARTKSIYSIWRKMKNKNIPFEEVYDILAMRVVFKSKEGMNEKNQCWDVYSIVTDLFKPKPDRLRDWISSPKANGYEALHTTVMSPSGRWVEIQIRSERMDEIAERGLAAHWKYKEDGKENEIDNWIKSIREMLEKAESNSLDFFDAFKLNLFASEMMIFTPKGESISMPIGSTALDFAFEIHTNLGYHCIGAKVNYRLEPLSYVLKSGDQVEIITSEKQKPKYEWLNYVTTAKAKACIKELFREERKNYIFMGEEILTQELQKRKLTITARILLKLKRTYHVSSKDELYFQIGKGTISLDNIEDALTMKTENKLVKIWKLTFGKSSSSDDDSDDETDEELDENANKKMPKGKNVILSDESETRRYTIASCCNPIPGDDVVAYVDEDNTMILHARRCPVAMKLMSSRGDRIVSAQWESHKVLSYLAQIELAGIDRKCLVSEVTKIISQDENVNMRSVHFESHDGVFTGNIFLYIYNATDLQLLIQKISKVKGVDRVSRKDRSEDNDFMRDMQEYTSF
ncbi:MAG: bifunctional (p)ppGpp synthetase/guanosine-3',5'-bis(diphosphate) 3'-pyrophosphohydrolase [Bacteroidales bacterium]|nr:bifunctional (p)ppGpp synthetase/guanosine-3',5'-bis(diphosphate) 3'-pyrophosphohydrolase [Bacteroidales bacterium]